MLISDLTRKSQPDTPIWLSQHQSAFEALKQALIEAPLLHAADTAKPFLLSTDASGVGIGAVLEQDSENGIVPVAFYSRKLKQCETKYGITELEALAIHQATKHFAAYLLGNHTTVFTDHKALTYMETMKKSTPRVARWLMELQQFQLTVKYRKGEDNVVADALSRSPVDDGHDQHEERVFLNQKAQFHSSEPGGKC